MENRHTAAGFPQRAHGRGVSVLSTTKIKAVSKVGLEHGLNGAIVASLLGVLTISGDGVLTISGIGIHDRGTSVHDQRNTHNETAIVRLPDV